MSAQKAVSPSPGPLVDGRFLLLETLGRGGMGAVYRAFDRGEDRVVALKVLEDDDGARGPASAIAREFTAWTSVRHPNVVRAFELGVARRGPVPAGTPYLVLELVDGGPLHRALEPGSVPAPLLLRIARSLLEALGQVHRAGLVHRDVKPGNVLVSRSRRRRLSFKLTDFGLAAASGHNGKPGHISGSIPYLSPEAILGRSVDGRSDLYGLGILLHHLATGRFPFPRGDTDAILAWHLAGASADPSWFRPSLPEPFVRLVSRLTEREPGNRLPGAVAGIALLEGLDETRARNPEPVVERGSRAELRLDLDAARLGARRVRRLPACAAAASRMRRDALVQGQVLGLEVHDLRPGPLRIGRLVLRSLLARGGDLRALSARHRLTPGLPMEFLGNTPVWSRIRGTSIEGPAIEATARGIASLLLEGGDRPAMVLAVESGAMADALARSVVRRLLAEVDDRAVAGRRGFLMVLGTGIAKVEARRYKSGIPGRSDP